MTRKLRNPTTLRNSHQRKNRRGLDGLLLSRLRLRLGLSVAAPDLQELPRDEGAEYAGDYADYHAQGREGPVERDGVNLQRRQLHGGPRNRGTIIGPTVTSEEADQPDHYSQERPARTPPLSPRSTRSTSFPRSTSSSNHLDHQ